jgi:predicted transcriptional regulator
VKHNLTITLDADLLKAARQLALNRDTSVNQMVRDFLEHEVEATSRRLASTQRLKKLFKTSTAQIGGRTWTRDELHER